MMRRWVLLMLVAVLAGCSGDSKTKSTADSKGSEKLSAVNPPSGQQTDKVQANPGPSPDKKSLENENSKDKIATEQSADRNKDMAKLRQVVLSMHNYIDATRKFPMAASVGGQVSKDLSWRVLVLPYLELKDEYSKFDLGQAWDSSANKPLIDTPALDAFELGNGNLICAIKCDEQPQNLAQISDGTSNTIALLETPDLKANQWTSPEDLTVADGVKLIRSLKKGEFVLAAFYDGSVRKLFSPEGKEIEDEEIAALFNPRDGLPINPNILTGSK